MRKFSLILLALCLSGCVSDRDVVVSDGWRVADKEDAVNDWARFNSPNKIIDDFNGDGRADIAQILLKDNGLNGYKFVVDVSSGDTIRQFQLEQSSDIAAQNVAIELLKPSSEIWDSACEKGYWDCKENEIRQFKIDKPSIQFCYIESACTVFIWSDRGQNFTKIPISD